MGVLLAKVISVDDEFDGGRIKARVIPDDARLSDENLPFAFPLLPKMLHVRPKVGESVFIICADDKNARSPRYYVGPLISQPQFMHQDYAEHSSSLLRGGMATESQAPSTSPTAIGAYPNNDDIAVIGRRNSEIILRETDEKTGTAEIDIRCGVRKDNTKMSIPAEFNELHPAYIQVKYQPYGMGTEHISTNGDSAINIVADNINLISPLSSSPSIPPVKKTDNDSLIDNETYQKVLNECHQLPYGDELVKFLNAFKEAFNTHTHAWVGAGQTPIPNGAYTKMNDYPMGTLLSEHVRIN